MKRLLLLLLSVSTIILITDNLYSNDEDYYKLFMALESGNKEKFEILLKSGIDINTTESENNVNLLMEVAFHGDVEKVKYLISKGININHTAKTGNNVLTSTLGSLCLHTKKEKQMVKIINILEKNGFNIYNIFDISFAFGTTQKRWNGLIYAVDIGNIKAAKYLLTRDFDIDYCDAKKMTALHHAADHYSSPCRHISYPKIVQLLLSKKAKVDSVDINGNTPLILASGNGSLKSIKILIKYKARINHQNSVGNTALIAAVKNTSKSCVQYLISKGAKVNIKNKNNKSALDIAHKMKDKGIIKALTEK